MELARLFQDTQRGCSPQGSYAIWASACASATICGGSWIPSPVKWPVEKTGCRWVLLAAVGYFSLVDAIAPTREKYIDVWMIDAIHEMRILSTSWLPVDLKWLPTSNGKAGQCALHCKISQRLQRQEKWLLATIHPPLWNTWQAYKMPSFAWAYWRNRNRWPGPCRMFYSFIMHLLNG